MMDQQLKEITDGLSKNWEVEESHEPFYSGGQVQIGASISLPVPSGKSSSTTISDESNLVVCMNDENIKILDWSTGGKKYSHSLLDDEDENRELVHNFCLHPNGAELVIATSTGLLRHYRATISGGITVEGNGGGSSQEESQTPRLQWEQVRAIKAHTMPIQSMSYDPSGTLLATGSADRSVKVWDVERGYCTHSFRGHTDMIQMVQFEDPRTGDEIDASLGVEGVLSQGLRLFSTAMDCTVRVYDLNESKCVATHSDHLSVCTALSTAARSKNPYLLATAGRDKVINFYEMRTHAHLKTHACMDELEACVWLTHEHGSRVLADTSSDNQHVLVAGGARGLLRFFKVEYAYSSGKKGFANGVGVELTCTPLLALAVTGTSALPSVLFSAGLNSNNNKLSTSLSSGSGDMDRPLDGLQAISHILYPGGKLGGFDDCESAPLVAVTDDQVMVSYSILPYSGETEETKSKSKGSKGNKDKGNNKGKGSQSQQPESQSGSLVRRRQLVGAHDDILDVACVPMKRVKGQRKRYQLAVATNGPHVRLTSLSARSAGAGEGGDTEDLLYGHTDTVLSLNGSPDGRWLVTSSKDRTVRLWDLHTRTCVGLGSGHTEGVGCVTSTAKASNYRSKRTYAFSAAGDKILKRWDLRVAIAAAEAGSSDNSDTQLSSISSISSLACTHSVRGHEKDVNCVALSPNDALLASGSQDKTIRLWSASDLSAVATLRGHKRGVWKVAFSSVDRILCSGSGDRTLRLWSMSDYTCLKTLEGHSASVLSVKFVAFNLPPQNQNQNNGNGKDKALMDTNNQEEGEMEQTGGGSNSNSRGRNAPTYNSMQVISGSADGLVRLWDVRSGECVRTFDKHTDKIWALAFPSDGGYTKDTKEEQELEQGEDKDDDSDDEEDSKSKKALSEAMVVDEVDVVEEEEACEYGIKEAFFVTGGSDSRLLVWKDGTELEESGRLGVLEERLMQEQQMDADVRAGRYGRALDAALKLGHSRKVLGILTSVLEAPASTSTAPAPDQKAMGSAFGQKGGEATNVAHRLDEYVRGWSDTQLEQVSEHLLDWNSNARYAFTSQALLLSLLCTRGADGCSKVKGLNDQVSAFLAYSERHYARVDKLHQASFLLDYLSSQMALLPAEAEMEKDIQKSTSGTSGTNGTGVVDPRERMAQLTGWRSKSGVMASTITTTNGVNSSTSEQQQPLLQIFGHASSGNQIGVGGAALSSDSESDSSDEEEEIREVREVEAAVVSEVENSKTKTKTPKKTPFKNNKTTPGKINSTPGNVTPATGKKDFAGKGTPGGGKGASAKKGTPSNNNGNNTNNGLSSTNNATPKSSGKGNKSRGGTPNDRPGSAKRKKIAEA